MWKHLLAVFLCVAITFADDPSPGTNVDAESAKDLGDIETILKLVKEVTQVSLQSTWTDLAAVVQRNFDVEF